MYQIRSTLKQKRHQADNASYDTDLFPESRVGLVLNMKTALLTFLSGCNRMNETYLIRLISL